MYLHNGLCIYVKKKLNVGNIVTFILSCSRIIHCWLNSMQSTAMTIQLKKCLNHYQNFLKNKLFQLFDPCFNSVHLFIITRVLQDRVKYSVMTTNTWSIFIIFSFCVTIIIKFALCIIFVI